MNDTFGIVEVAYDWLIGSLENADGPAELTSPYISYDVCRRIIEATAQHDHSVRVITTLDASAVANGYLSVQGLRQLLAADIEVLHTERLHAKCFIVGSRGLLGSGNLTGAGLGSSAKRNREMGVKLNPVQVEDVRRAIGIWPSKLVSPGDLTFLLESAAKIATTKAPGEVFDATSALQIVERLLADARQPNRSLWLKLEYGAPKLGGWLEESLIASPKKGRPSFRPGDLVVICAKETGDCYAVVEISSEPEFKPDDYVQALSSYAPDDCERWPWINRTIPRLVPEELLSLKRDELGVSGQGLQNGHVRLQLDQFAMGVRTLSRLMTRE